MALRPPRDFEPLMSVPAAPSDRELRDVWRVSQRRRAERERARCWREVIEEVRRDAAGQLQLVGRDRGLPGFLVGGRALGSCSRGVLRPVARQGRVVGAGVDTWSPCWYAEPGSSLARAMGVLASERVGRACLVGDLVGGYRVGWFPEWGLVFAEGRPCGEALSSVGELWSRFVELEQMLVDVGIPVFLGRRAGLRRLDVAVDLWMGVGLEGLAFLECVGGSSFGFGKVVVFRLGRCVQSVLVKSPGGRSLARVYDKGAETGVVSSGCWLRLEAQWRFGHDRRVGVEGLTVEFVRNRFSGRFDALWKASAGCRIGGLDAVVGRISRAVADGQLRESRARSVVGYLVMASAGFSGGARRTVYELERECRELGVSVSMLEGRDERLDVATVLDECMAPFVWGR